MKESSQGTTYNVSDDLAEWARARVALWTTEQRNAIEQEFHRRAQEFHGERIAYRASVNGWPRRV